MSGPTAPEPNEPLNRLQAHLISLKKVLGLLRDVLVEFKDLLVIITVIVFFVLGVYEALKRVLMAQPHSEVQIQSTRENVTRK